jgi:excinuclease ABC subunit A
LRQSDQQLACPGLVPGADWVLDLGPGVEDVAEPQRGVRGGEIVAQGTPEQVAKEPRSFTGRYLAPMLDKQRAREAAE